MISKTLSCGRGYLFYTDKKGSIFKNIRIRLDGRAKASYVQHSYYGIIVPSLNVNI